MHVLYLADINSAHTVRWATMLHDKGVKVSIFTLAVPLSKWYSKYGIGVHFGGAFSRQFQSSGGLQKLLYLLAKKKLLNVLSEIRPDVVHAHYATSYGLLGKLSGYHPYVVSMYGTDIYKFPEKSPLHRYLLKRILNSADILQSSGTAMASRASLYTGKKIRIIPFGVDCTVFQPSIFQHSGQGKVIGTVKSLEKPYAIDKLIRAFHILRQDLPGYPLKLLIVGGGSLEGELRALSEELGLHDFVTFTGKVEYAEVPGYYHMLDVYVSLSIYESFGVAALEAAASGIPVVTSDADGFKEVVNDGVNGFLVTGGDPKVAAARLKALILDDKLRTSMGTEGRNWVLSKFNIEQHILDQISVYNDLINH